MDQTDQPLIPCPPDLRLTDAQVFTLTARGGMPEWAVEPCLLDFVLTGTGKPDVLRPLETWRVWAVKHVWAMWSDPSRRPKKPEAPQSPGQLQALRRAASRRRAAERARAEAAWAAYVAESGPPSPETLRQLSALGVRPPVTTENRVPANPRPAKPLPPQPGSKNVPQANVVAARGGFGSTPGGSR